MSKDEGYCFAERLARSMGYRLKRFLKTGSVRLFEKENPFPVTSWPWYRRGEIVRGGGFTRHGLLSMGDMKFRGHSLPPGITRDSSDEEIDIVLSAMGF